MMQWLVEHVGLGEAMLLLAAVGWYAASRAAAEIWTRRQSAPGRRALAHALVAAPALIVAVFLGEPRIAVVLIFGASVTALTMVLGILTMSTTPAPMVSRPVWAFVLPTAMLTMLAGFAGELNYLHAVLLLGQGLAARMMWRGNSPQPVGAVSQPRLKASDIVQFTIAIVAAVIAGICAVLAARSISNELGLPRTDLVAALMLAPALVLPLVGWGAGRARVGEFDQVISTLVGFVLVNLCVLLPLSIVVWGARPYVLQATHKIMPATASTTAPSTSPTSAPSEQVAAEPFPFPIVTWRVDALFLVAVALVLVPAAMGRWTLGQAEGAALLLGYLIYMVMTTRMAR